MTQTPLPVHRPSEPLRLLPWAELACASIVRAAAVVGFVLGASNLAVWLIPSTRVAASWAGVMVMRANAAVGIIAASLSLIIWHFADGRPATRRAAAACGFLAALIGGLTSLEYLAGVNLGLDQLLVSGTFPGDQADAFVVAPGRMSLNAALSLLFLGLALTGLDGSVQLGNSRRLFTAPFFAVLAGLPAAGGLVGYLLGERGFTSLLRSTNILLHVATSLFLLSLGVFAARPHRAPVSGIFSPGPSGVLLRWLLPGSTGLLLVLAWAIGKGRAAGLVAAGEATALMLYGGLILLFVLIVAASRAVARQEESARHATEQLARAKGQAEAVSRALAEAAERFHFLAESLSLQVWTARPNGELDFANQEVAQYFGGEVERDIFGNAWAQFVHEDDLPLALRCWRASLATGERYEVEFRLRRNDGAYRWFLVRAQPMRDDGRIVSWFGTNTDIHDLKTAQRDAVAASRAKDDFLAALSHELRTPLTPVLLSAQALRHDVRLPEDLRAELAMIERNITLEGRLIDDLLDLTRIARGKLPIRMEHCDAHSLLGHSIEIIRDEAQGKRVTVSLDLRASRRGVVGDSARLQQVFWNLLRNAVKFTPAGGHIDIRTRDSAAAGMLVLEVSDSGFGFVPELAERLFLPFEQEARDGHHRFGGLGLGLAIARAIVDLHGGAIHAASPGPGLGATFTVELPSTIEAPPGIAPFEPGPAAPDDLAPPLRILLVEDHEATVAVLSRLLRRSGHQVVAAGSLAAAIAANRRETFDVVISDLGLPDGSGLELIKALRADHPTLRGIALSGYGMDEDMLRSREAGFFFHLVKPVDFDQLTRALRDLGRLAGGSGG